MSRRCDNIYCSAASIAIEDLDFKRHSIINARLRFRDVPLDQSRNRKRMLGIE